MHGRADEERSRTRIGNVFVREKQKSKLELLSPPPPRGDCPTSRGPVGSLCKLSMQQSLAFALLLVCFPPLPVHVLIPRGKQRPTSSENKQGFSIYVVLPQIQGTTRQSSPIFFDLCMCRMKHFVVVTTCCSVHTLGVKGKSGCGHNDCALAKVNNLVVTSSAWSKRDPR